MQAQLVRSLYRRTLRVVAQVERCGAAKRARERWAEFVPDTIMLDSSETLPQVARRCYKEPAHTVRLQAAFDFLKEANTDIALLCLLRQWDVIAAADEYDVVSGLALISAAIEVPALQVSHSAVSQLPQRMTAFATFWRELVHRIVSRVRRGATEEAARTGIAHTATDVERVLAVARCEVGLRRREACAEDYSLVSAVAEGRCAECVLNVLLKEVFDALHWNNSLVGEDLAFRWLRLAPPTVRRVPLFVSWSYGVLTRDKVQGCIRRADKRWCAVTPWDVTQRKQVLRTFLRRQLACLSLEAPSVNAVRRRKICKEQLLALLS